MKDRNDEVIETESSPPEKKEIVKKVFVDPDIVNKMKRLSSLYIDELGDNPKEIEILSFFFKKAFEKFLFSGEIEGKVKEIAKM